MKKILRAVVLLEVYRVFLFTL